MEAGGDALVEGGEDAEAELVIEGGLTDEDASEGALGIHVGVGEQAQLFELVGLEEVGLVDDEDDAAVAFSLFGLEHLLSLGHELGPEKARLSAQSADHGDIEA